MAALPLPPAGRSHSVGLLTFCRGPLRLLGLLPMPERKGDYKHLYPIMISKKRLYVG